MTTSIIGPSARRKRLLRFAQAPSPTHASAAHVISEVRGFQMPSWSILQVHTRAGQIGYGECNVLSGPDLQAANQALAGKAASAYQALDGTVPATVRGGLNIALLDILGKATRAPVYRVLVRVSAMHMVDGRIALPTKPGLGFELSESALSKYPFGGTKPMEFVFHQDGSVAAL